MQTFKEDFGPLTPHYTLTEDLILVNEKPINWQMEIYSSLFERICRIVNIKEFSTEESVYSLDAKTAQLMFIYLGKIWPEERVLVRLKDQAPMFGEEVTSA